MVSEMAMRQRAADTASSVECVEHQAKGYCDLLHVGS